MLRRFEQMYAGGEVRRQPLLIPQTVNLPREEVELLLAGGQIWERLGFEIEQLGEEALVIRQIPALLRGGDVEVLLQELLAQAKRQDMEAEAEAITSRLLPALVERLVAATPIHELSEADSLLRQLEEMPQQGREFWRPLSLEQLRQWFESHGRKGR